MTFSKFITIFFVLIGSVSGFSQTHTWSGIGGDNDWHNILNWDINTIPTSTSPVVIPENAIVNILNDNAAAYTILLSPNAALTIERDLTFTQLLTITPDALFIWKDGTLSGGVIENDGEIAIETLVFKDLYNTTINNRNRISITNSSSIRLFNTTTINNLASGDIIINSNGGIIEQSASNATINNSGLIKKVNSGSPGGFYMIYDMNNYGIIDIDEDQTFLFLVFSQNFNNLEEGILRGKGDYDITATFTNTGTVSPSDESTIGAIEIVNNFSMSTPANLIINIEGVNSGEYDTINVFGDPDLQGTIAINLDFAPIINDEFTIITTTSTIPSCDFPSQTSTTFNGSTYTFDIICNSNSVVLKLNNVTLHTEDFGLISSSFFVAPNPTNNDSKFVIPDTLSNRDLTLNIYNYLGQKVSTLNDITQFEFQKLTRGLYFAQLLDNQIVIATTKFITK